MNIFIRFALLVPLLLLSCSRSVEIQYNFSEPVEYQVFREGYYSTQNREGEVVGTIARWWSTEKLIPSGAGAVWSRKYDMQKSEGYHRHSMPSELLTRLALQAHVDSSEMREIKGLSNFESDVVDLLPVRKVFKEPLRSPALLERFDAELKLWWRATHLFKGRIPMRGVITALIDSSLDLSPLQVDSVVALGDVKVEDRNCFNYKIYYKVAEVPDIDLMFEQFRAADTLDRADYSDYAATSGIATGSWGVWIDPRQGTLCREQDWRDLSITVSHKESGENREVIARVAVERLYTYDLEEQTRRFNKRAFGAE